MKYRVEWTLSGSSEVEADNALDAALAVSDCAYVEQGQTFEIIKSEPTRLKGNWRNKYMGRVSKKMRRQAAIALAKNGYSREAVEKMAIEASKMNVADDILKKAAKKEARGKAIAERTLKDYDRAVTQAISTTALMACWALHNAYGFGSKRLKTVLNEFDKTCGVMLKENNDKSDSHPLCWEDIAEALKDETGMDFWQEWRTLPALNDKTTGLAS